MKKKIVVGGSIGAVVLLILAMFPSVVGAQTTTLIGKIIDSEIVDGENIKKVKKLVPPGWYLGVLFNLLISLIIWFSIQFLT